MHNNGCNNGASPQPQPVGAKSKKLMRFDKKNSFAGIDENNDDELPSDDELCEDANNNRTIDYSASNGSSSSHDFGFPPNLPQKGIQIKSEKGLITMLEGVHSQSDQPYSLYKCCLCGFAFPCLEPMIAHIQTMHLNSSSQLTCDKCGATFKWRSELQLHEHIHTAMEQQGNTTSQLPLLPSFLQPNLALLGPYLSEQYEKSSSKTNGSLNGSSNKPAISDNRENQGLNLSAALNLAAFKKDDPLASFNNRIKDELLPKRHKSKETRSPIVDSSDDAMSLLKDNPFRPKLTSTLGEIEETAPGQFKCRFCDKTFDRIFSVHRHERVHTGYKPCICKVCGRGFSEKRNLRHHIIRFHSDGSGRELLKRARKDKTLAATTKQLAATVLKKAALKYLGNDANDDENDLRQSTRLSEPDVKIEVDEDNDDQHDAMSSENEAAYNGNGNQNDSSDNMQALKLDAAGEGSSRRRKSKPSKKVAVETAQVEHESEIDEDNERLDEDDGESKNDDDQATILEDDEENNCENDLEKDLVLSHREADGDMSSDSYGTGGNQSENSVEGSLSKSTSHGAFFSSYSPRWVFDCDHRADHPVLMRRSFRSQTRNC